MELKIVPYHEKWLPQFEKFRQTALDEGNDSLIHSKLDANSLNGLLLLCFFGDELISVSACEASHYTGDPKIAARICRYHVLKSARPKFLYCGFQMMKKHCEWADKQNYEIVYFTQDTKNRPLNSLYQKKRKYGFGASNDWFNDPEFQSFELSNEMLFQVSKKSPLLQYVYIRKRDPNFKWNPLHNMVPMKEVSSELSL